MSRVPPVDLVFLWHHHQPDYRSPRAGHALLPWVRLHATKDYLDMALHLERHPRVKATFNFVPSLLDQLDEAAAGAPDALFPLLARPPAELDAEQRAEVLLRCAAAPPWAHDRWPRFRALAQKATRARRAGARETLSESELVALEGWFLLAWLDPLFHAEPAAAAALARQADPGVPERDALLALHAALLARVVPAYRALAERGQIELSESAYYHPILPLLVSHQSARRARPQMALPAEPFAAPEDATRQVERALARHERAFGARPLGMWPPEGSVSPEVCEIVARAGVRWLATDEGVLWSSLGAAERARAALYRPWRVVTPAGDVALFFRDHELSDRIGFVYHHWDAQEAVLDFLARLRRIAQDHGGETAPVVSVILDGENCWEHYPDDGGPFLEALYTVLETAPDVRTRTPSEVLAGLGAAGAPRLPSLHTGSWIDADFHIWIGHAEKNRAWDLLARTRRALVEAGSTPEAHPEAWEELAAAEGSDWFWWYGEDHYTADRALFDRIFREHLMGARERAGLPVPGELLLPVARQRARRAGVQPQNFIHPEIDGRRTHFYEWHGAGSFKMGAGGGSMHKAAGLAREVFFGFDALQLFLRVDFNAALPGEPVDLMLEIMAPRPVRLVVQGLVAGERPVLWGGGPRIGKPVEGARACAGTVLELAVPFASLKLKPHECVEMIAQLAEKGAPLESLPDEDVMRFEVPDEDFEQIMWEA